MYFHQWIKCFLSAVPILPDYLAKINSGALVSPPPISRDTHEIPYYLKGVLTKHPRIPGDSSINVVTKPPPPLPKANYTDILEAENSSIGLLLAMKALVQLILNPIVGNYSAKFGYRLPILLGTGFLMVSSLGMFDVFVGSWMYVSLFSSFPWKCLLSVKHMLHYWLLELYKALDQPVLVSVEWVWLLK